jgi:3-oxoacyl-[acyl-carrier protein] reductase
MDFCEEIKKITDLVEVVVLNCGTTEKTPYGEITQESWEKIMNLNLNCPFYLVQALDKMIEPESGRIIFISSVMGKYPHSSSLVYNVSKAAVISLANSLVKYYSDRKITVNSICPGFINTPYHDNRPQESIDKINSKIALNRFGESDEVSSLVMEIIHNQYINGSAIDINGGYNYY